MLAEEGCAPGYYTTGGVLVVEEGDPRVGALTDTGVQGTTFGKLAQYFFFFFLSPDFKCGSSIARYYVNYANEHTPSAEQLHNTYLCEHSFCSAGACRIRRR